MLIFRFIILFWVATRIGLNALILKKHISFPTLHTAAHSVLAPVSLRTLHPPITQTALTGQLTHA